MRVKPALIPALALVALFAVAAAYVSRTGVTPDPDRFFHASLCATDSWTPPETIPQADGLSWAKSFVDKEYLFHVVCKAVPQPERLMAPLFSLILFGLLCFIASRFSSKSVALLTIALAWVLHPAFLFRMTLFRPHLLAVPLFAGVLGGLMFASPWVVGVSSALFALSYHAIYVPLAVIGLSVLVRAATGDRGFKVEAWGLAGLVIGTLVHPHFPGNLEMMKMHLGLAVLGGDANAAGYELAAWSTSQWVMLHLGSVGLLVLAAGVRTDSWATQARRAYWLTLGTAVLFLCLSLLTPRAVEYAVPAIGLCLAIALASFTFSLRVVSGLLLVLIGGLLSAQTYRESASTPRGEPDAVERAAVGLIPGDGSIKRVFNCEWETGPWLLHFRPELRFIDLLDPGFLKRFDLGLHWLREALNQGTLGDPWLAVREIFNADATFCIAERANQRLALDPGFAQLTPWVQRTAQGEFPTVFRVRPVRPDGVALRYSFSSTGKAPMKVDPQLLKRPTTWLSREHWGDASCVKVRPELRVGTQFVVVQFRGNLEVGLPQNPTPWLKTSSEETVKGVWISAGARLATDLEFHVCGVLGDEGISVSGLTKEEFSMRCRDAAPGTLQSECFWF